MVAEVDLEKAGESSFRTTIPTPRQVDVGSSLEWTHLTFAVGDKKILNDCSGTLRPGELTAVLGPSGSGKSTLMNVLGGRQGLKGPGRSFKGAVSFNGRVEDPVHFRNRIAYVMQDDTLVATSTPEEILRFSANLRLADTNRKEVNELVSNLLDSLKLTNCKDTVVGNEIIKGISGGERKRTSVGVELITKPEMIFLDEPLTGLDSYAATTTVKVLKDLAANGVPVMITVHQPSSEIFAMFDNIVVISEGCIVYDGPRKELVDFFYENGGYKCPSNYNPADYVLYVLQTEPRENIEVLVDAYKVYFEKRMMSGIDELRGEAVQQAEVHSKARVASLRVQLRELLKRDFRDIIRNPTVQIIKFCMTVFMGLIMGCVFFQAGADESEMYWLTNRGRFQSYYGGIVITCVAAMMGSAQTTILRYPDQRAIFVREYASNMYSSIPYVLSQTLLEVPMAFIESVIQIIIAYFMLNFQGSWILWVLSNLLINLVSASFAQFLGALANSGAQAMQFMPLILVPQMIFSGLFTPISEIPVWLRWLQYLSFLKYTGSLAYFNEFGFDMTLLNEANDIHADLVGLYIGVLLAMLIILRILATVILKRKARYVY
ncbi:Protein white, putative [Perkinsus marinus ATCC 50983]|uniref:Protein white, putative n=1 Tax=Perkinsus marinus (strain ATCC 50983 / TXsc) TaxID=423536 RepID=C5KS55_PERM5|nr:Protein white, putative [Perkinsus marinus ATCC 50983]EER12686.1 Protein white, putative [Perkinsus marinus ATCC 50983]|eukprot:XP_002780891.1 Protein white, putative [Perkinsus marinus ATCC 50983]